MQYLWGLTPAVLCDNIVLYSKGEKMKALQSLPEGYIEILNIDLQKNKKLAVSVNVLAAIIAVVFTVPAHFLVPIRSLFDMSQGMLVYGMRLAVLCVGVIAYIILHELVHGIAMKICGTKKVKYGFTGIYAFAGSDDYYDKKSYIIIALAPIAVWGIVLKEIKQRICFQHPSIWRVLFYPASN